MKHQSLKLQYKKRILLYVIVVVFIPIIILGLYSYQTYMNEVTRTVNVSMEATVNQVQNRIDSLLLNVQKYYIEAAEADDINPALQKSLDFKHYNQIKDAIDVMDGPAYLNDYISGFTFINYNTGQVISNRGIYTYEEITNKEKLNEVFRDKLDTLERSYWIYSSPSTNITEPSRETVNFNDLCFVMKLPIIKKNPYAMLVINMNQSKIETMLKTDLANGDITVVDEYGDIVYTTDREVSKYCKSNLDSISTDAVKKISLENGKEYNIVKAFSGALNWTYILSYDFEMVRDGGMNILSIMLFLIVIFVVLLTFIFIVTSRIYMPVSNLTRYMGSILNPCEKSKYEFDYLEDSIHKLADDKANLENIVISQQPQLLELFQLRLLRSDMKQEKIDYYINRLGIERQEFAAVISVSIKTQMWEDEYDEASQDALRIDLVDNFPGSLLQRLLMPPICNERAIFFTISAERKEILEQKAFEMYQELEEYVGNTYQLSINVGISSPFTAFSMFRNAYNESMEALKNNDILSKEAGNEICHSSMMFYSDIVPGHISYNYPIILEKEVKEAVDSCDKEKAFDVINRFMDELIVNDVSSSESYLYLHRFLIAIMLVATDAGVSVNTIFHSADKNIFFKFNQLYNMEKIRSFYKFKVAVPIISELGKFRTGKSAEIMQSIEKLVELSKGDITLTECADQLNYHPTYIWKIMKMERNTTFSDYIAEYKISEAKKMLRDTNQSVADIARLLNYTNTQNFIRFFSKHEGITPGKYRVTLDE